MSPSRRRLHLWGVLRITFSRMAAGALVLLLGTAARAQEVLTLDEATAQALAHNPALQAVRAGVDERDAEVAAARAGFWATLTVAETWDRGNQPTFVFGSLLAARRFTAASFAVDALNHPEAASLHRVALTVRQPLFDAAQRATVARARLTRDLSGVDLDDRRAAIAEATTTAYGRALTADASRRAVDAAYEAARADRARAAARRDAGLVLEADVLALDAHLAALAQRAAVAAGDAAIARADLNRLMGAPLETPRQLADGTASDATPTDLELAPLLAEAERNHPDQRRAAVNARLAGLDRGLARAALLPRVHAQAGLEANGLRADDRASSWMVGAGVTWQLSLGGAERARLRGAASAVTRAAAEADDARAAVQLRVVTALTGRRVAIARLAAGRAAVDQARESERHVRDRYEAGLAGLTDLLRAQSAVLDADAQRTAARVDALVSAAQLARALGRRP